MNIRSKKLNAAVKEFVRAMKTRLAQKEREGYKGWDGKYPDRYLLAGMKANVLMLSDADTPAALIPKLCTDIANWCMMVRYRHQRKAAQDKRILSHLIKKYGN